MNIIIFYIMKSPLKRIWYWGFFQKSKSIECFVICTIVGFWWQPQWKGKKYDELHSTSARGGGILGTMSKNKLFNKLWIEWKGRGGGGWFEILSIVESTIYICKVWIILQSEVNLSVSLTTPLTPNIYFILISLHHFRIVRIFIAIDHGGFYVCW